MQKLTYAKELLVAGGFGWTVSCPAGATRTVLLAWNLENSGSDSDFHENEVFTWQRLGRLQNNEGQRVQHVSMHTSSLAWPLTSALALVASLCNLICKKPTSQNLPSHISAAHLWSTQDAEQYRGRTLRIVAPHKACPQNEYTNTIKLV